MMLTPAGASRFVSSSSSPRTKRGGNLLNKFKDKTSGKLKGLQSGVKSFVDKVDRHLDTLETG